MHRPPHRTYHPRGLGDQHDRSSQAGWVALAVAGLLFWVMSSGAK